MKYYLVVPILAAFILAGCARENSIVGPPSQQTQAKREWIKINTTASLAVENSYTASKSIDGSKGGTIELTQAKREWIKINSTASLAVENSYTASKSIDGSKGGTIELTQAKREWIKINTTASLAVENSY